MVYCKKVDDSVPVLGYLALDTLGLIASTFYGSSQDPWTNDYIYHVLINNGKNPRRKLRKVIFATKDKFSADQLREIERHRNALKAHGE